MTVLAGLVTALSLAPAARAEDPNVAARAAFHEATELVKQAQWGEALAAFERAAKLRPHAVTTFDIAACERAIGHVTRARATFRRALAQDASSGETELPASMKEEAAGYLVELDRQIATAAVRVTPDDSSILVDGRPLEPGGAGELVAGIAPPGPATPVPRGELRIEADPGLHVLTLSRKGSSDVMLRRTFVPGTTLALTIELDRLPASIRVESNVPDAIVRLNGDDLGPVPVDVLRPAGAYHVSVVRRGFVPYDAQLVARAGEAISLRAPLREDKPGLTQRWWFWTAAGVLVAGAAAGTYFATRPAPTRPAVGEGSLGWSATVP